MNRIDAIYTRQSVDRADSISVESQVEFCKKEVLGENIEIYTDRGYSGKNTDRPAFQKMMTDITSGRIRRVIVYRLDRISRSVLDFASVIDVFQRHGVDFVSTMEKFDTGTPIGKAMLMIVMIFAQLERETIQQRVADAYSSRSKRGLYMGGKVPYGFRLKETIVDGIRTKMYEAVPEEIPIIVQIFSMYAQPQTSLGDIARWLDSNQIKKRSGEPFSRSRIRDLVINPAYVRADCSLYHFYRSQGTIIENPPEDFIGTNGAYLYSGVEGRRKTVSPQGHILVLAPHEGLISSDIWIKCRRKCLNNAKIAKPVKAKATWLAGKIRCARCGCALSAKVYHCKTKADNRYYLCSNRQSVGGCDAGALDADIVDKIVFGEMTKKLEEFGVLTKQRKGTGDLQSNRLKIRIESINQEIKSLMDKIPMANETVMEYINRQTNALDEEKKRLHAEIFRLVEGGRCCGDKITGYLTKWEKISMCEKIAVVDSLIENIVASQERIRINWKI